MIVKPTDKIGDIIYYQKRTGGKRNPKYILGTDRQGNLKWLDYNLFTVRRY